MAISKPKAVGSRTGITGLLNVRRETSGEQIDQIAIDLISPNPKQPRSHFDGDALAELASSIKEHGILQPLIVTGDQTVEGRYWLIAGERRLRAAGIAGLATVPAIVREATMAQLAEWALVENVQRADLSAIEEAKAYQQLIDELHLTQEQVADRVGKSRSAVANKLRLLKLPDAVQAAIAEGKIEEAHGRELLRIPPDWATATMRVFRQLIDHEWSKRDLKWNIDQVMVAVNRQAQKPAVNSEATYVSPGASASNQLSQPAIISTTYVSRDVPSTEDERAAAEDFRAQRDESTCINKEKMLEIWLPVTKLDSRVIWNDVRFWRLLAKRQGSYLPTDSAERATSVLDLLNYYLDKLCNSAMIWCNGAVRVYNLDTLRSIVAELQEIFDPSAATSIPDWLKGWGEEGEDEVWRRFEHEIGGDWDNLADQVEEIEQERVLMRAIAECGNQITVGIFKHRLQQIRLADAAEAEVRR